MALIAFGLGIAIAIAIWGTDQDDRTGFFEEIDKLRLGKLEDRNDRCRLRCFRDCYCLVRKDEVSVDL